jgi:hypothetical protein
MVCAVLGLYTVSSVGAGVRRQGLAQATEPSCVGSTWRRRPNQSPKRCVFQIKTGLWIMPIHNNSRKIKPASVRAVGNLSKTMKVSFVKHGNINKHKRADSRHEITVLSHLIPIFEHVTLFSTNPARISESVEHTKQSVSYPNLLTSRNGNYSPGISLYSLSTPHFIQTQKSDRANNTHINKLK